VIDVDVAEGDARHARIVGLAGILHDGDAAPLLDGLQADGAVVELAGQHHADDPRSMGARG
jgi:hypothetical protein